MPLFIVIDAVLILVVGVGLGWPWGVVVALGCLLIPLGVMRFLLRFTTVHRGHPLERRFVRATVIRLTPEQVESTQAAIPGKAGDAGTERK